MGRRTNDPENSGREATEKYEGTEKVPIHEKGERADVCSLSRTLGH